MNIHNVSLEHYQGIAVTNPGLYLRFNRQSPDPIVYVSVTFSVASIVSSIMSLLSYLDVIHAVIDETNNGYYATNVNESDHMDGDEMNGTDTKFAKHEILLDGAPTNVLTMQSIDANETIYKNPTRKNSRNKPHHFSDPIIRALKLYQLSSVNANNLEISQDLVEFFGKAFPVIIDAYTKTVLDHDQLQELRQRVKNIIHCVPNDCPFIKMHFEDTRTPSKNYFYIDFMNSIHCNLVHPTIFEVQHTKQSKTKENSIKRNFESRFIINLDTAGEAHMDELVQYIGQNEDVLTLSLNHMARFMIDQEYDTEAIEYDVILEHQSFLKILDSVIWMHLNHYFYLSKCMYLFVSREKRPQILNLPLPVFSRTFSIGYRFYYWEYYKNDEIERVFVLVLLDHQLVDWWDRYYMVPDCHCNSTLLLQ